MTGPDCGRPLTPRSLRSKPGRPISRKLKSLPGPCAVTTNGSSPPLLFGSSKLASDVVSLTGMANSGAAAGPWIIGDRDEECSGGANQVGNDVQVQKNKNRIDVADNNQGAPPYAVGIGNDLQVLGNTVSSNSPVVESNFVGNTAQCQAGSKKDADGTPNIVGISNQGCP